MNPHLQPHSNPPYPQNNPQYPQANPSYPSGTFSGPSKYPTLPPVQNPQQNYPPLPSPQQNYPSQPYPQFNPNLGGRPGYVPPTQFGNIQDRSLQDGNSEKMRLHAEMEELEKRLKTGCVQFHAIGSYVTAACTILFYIWLLFKVYPNLARPGQNFLLCFGAAIIWIVIQSYLAASAVTKKSLGKATAACWMMGICLIPSLFLEVLFVCVCVTARPGSIEYGFSMFIMIILTVHLVILVFVNMIGAFKARKILVERAKIEMKLIENSFNNHA